jgi:hypothetical protein
MRAARFALFILILAAAPLFAADKWWDFYKRGTAAAQTNEWASVSQNMQRAIAEKPSEELSARARNEILLYVPHFWLGVAKANSGDPDGALAEFRTSESMGVVQRTQYWSDLRKWRSHAEGQKAKKASEQSSDSRMEADLALQKALRGHMQAITAGAGRLETFKAAQRKMSDAREQYKVAGNDRKGYQQAAATANGAYDLFVAAAEEAKKKAAGGKGKSSKPPVVQPPVQVATTTTQDDELVDIVVVQAVESKIVAGARIDVQQLRRRLTSTRGTSAELRAFLREAQKQATGWDEELRAKPSDGEADEIAIEVARLDRELTTRLAAVEAHPVSSGTETAVVAKSLPGEKLQMAYVAFANGNVARSEQLLEAYVTENRKDSEGYLLRGCVRYTRAMLSRQPESLLPSAEADFRKALELNRRIGLDAKQFSPKLVAFFNEVRKQRAGVR